MVGIISKQINVLVADDHQLFREGLIDLINRDKNVKVIEEAKNGNQAVALAMNLDLHLAIVDINMPELNGIEVLKKVKQLRPQLPFIALTMHNDPAYIQDAFKNGFMGYLLKDSSVSELHNAIHSVYQGKKYISEDLQHLAIEKFLSPKPSNLLQDSLTKRELEILQLIVKEYTNQEISDKLKISVRTVETHKRNLIEKAGAKNIVGLIYYAAKIGLTP